MLNYRLPISVWLAAALFTTLLAVSSWNVRGVADPEGYILNTNQFMSINSYEDDGAVVMFLSLDLAKDFHSWSKWVLNIGSPFILSARVLIRLADWLGVVTRFDEPSLYLLYPEKLIGIWRLVGLYKAALLFCCPVVLFWIGRNFFSERTGLLAAWLMALMPFPLAFEGRGKVDLLAIACGLFSLLYQMAYAKDRRIKHLLAASVFLGLSLAFKLIMVPAAFTLFIAFVLSIDPGQRLALRSYKPLIWAGAAGFLVYLAANPFMVPGLASTLSLYSSNLLATKASSLKEVLEATVYRLAHLDSLQGQWTPWLLGPGLALLIFRLPKSREKWLPQLLLPLFILIDIIYLSSIMQERLRFLTYYYYAISVTLLLIAAFFLDEAGKLFSRNRAMSILSPLLIAGTLFASFQDQWRVLQLMLTRTNRQLAHEWIFQHVAPGTSVGIPLRQGSEFFNTNIRLDPFRYDLSLVGSQAQWLKDSYPQYVLWERDAPEAPPLRDPGYHLAAEFNQGKNLPHERYDLYQEQTFAVYRKISSPADSPSRPAIFETQLGEYFRQHPQEDCNLLQYQALYFYPISMNLMRLAGNAVQPFATGAFFSKIRQEEDPPAYLHTIDPGLLDIWGVKYILARVDPAGGFMEKTVDSGYYPLEEKWRADRLMPDGSTRCVALLVNHDYRGGAIFIPDAAKVFEARPKNGLLGFGRRLLLPYGRFFSREEFQELGVDALEISLDFTCDRPVDVILKGGKRRQSLQLGPGHQTIRTVYTVGKPSEDVGYEINPLHGDKTNIVVKFLKASPLVLQGEPTVKCESLNQYSGFARMNSPIPGQVIFSMPYHEHWQAQVDGNPAAVVPGISGTLAVPVTAGDHFVALLCR